MADYIDRDAVYHAISVDCALNIYEKAYFLDIVRKITSADVAPVRHGQWVLIEESPDRDIYECNWCGRMVTKRFSYFHCCGAKMDGGESNERMDQCGGQAAEPGRSGTG